MSDRISNYRQVRLVLQVPVNGASQTYWSLHAVGVKGGIPTARVLLDGFVPALHQQCTTEEILEAIDAAVRGAML